MRERKNGGKLLSSSERNISRPLRKEKPLIAGEEIIFIPQGERF